MTTDPDDIACWQRIDARITTSGSLAATDIARLAGIGVEHIVNLALPDSPRALAGEEDLVAAQGLRYTHIPVPFDQPDESHFAKFRAAMDADAAPIHIHCVMNWRVSGFLYRYNREVRGMADAEARALLERQWSPETADHADAPAWAQFIVGGRR